MDEALVASTALVGRPREFDEVAVARGPISGSADFRYWRCALADGSRVSMDFNDKAGGRAAIGLGHERIATQADAER